MLLCRYIGCATMVLIALLFATSAANGQTFDRSTTAKQYEKYIANNAPLPSPYYLCQWQGTLPPSALVVRSLADNVAIIKVADRSKIDHTMELFITPANNSWKFSPALEQATTKPTNATQKFIVTGSNFGMLSAAIRKFVPASKILHSDVSTNSLVVESSSKYLYEKLAPLEEIIFIDIVIAAHSETNIIGYNRSFHGINAVDYLVPGANGKGIVVGVKEQNMDETDLDLWKRVNPSPISSGASSSHATVIASIIGGAGNSFYDGRGIAWGSTFFSSTFSNLFADDTAVLKTHRVTVQNHSYGTAIQQFYGAEAVSYDAAGWNNKKYIAVMSSGNLGETSASEGKYANLPGFANLTGNFKASKNSITVAAIDNKEMVAAQSSAGPLYDGRIAPQITALGPNGTSDAAAVVSGTIAVLQQVYADSNNNNLPDASLVKAVLYNTATDLLRPGIDYKTGFGLLDSYAAVRAMQQRKYDAAAVSNGQVWTKTLQVPANAANLKVTLCWTDTAASVNNNKALVNDLDLEVRDLNNGIVYQPWVLNSTPRADSLSALPVRKRDSLNTAEQVTILLPAQGNYQVTVKGTSVQSGSLPFSIAYQVNTLNTFEFTSPQHASDVNIEESATATIRWKTYVADTNKTGSLYVSYNNGNSWQSLSAVIKLHINKYQWLLKDTAVVARLKMEADFGTFYSWNFVIGKTTKLNVDFNCSDSVGLSWSRQPNATAYRLFTLSDSAYLKVVQTIADTFTVVRRGNNAMRVYAVQPVLASGVEAARSIAINVDLQGVQCFYKVLNYELLDNNRMALILELSTASYVDSVDFEQVNAGGGLLKTYARVAVKTAGLVYRTEVNDLATGVTYVRAKIILKNGAVVYTDVLPVITPGAKNILFYPNPILRSTTLSYVLQQGVTVNQLQLFTADGRLIRNFLPLPDKINLASIQPGILIYKLFDNQNKLIETGKIVVQ